MSNNRNTAMSENFQSLYGDKNTELRDAMNRNHEANVEGFLGRLPNLNIQGTKTGRIRANSEFPHSNTPKR